MLIERVKSLTELLISSVLFLLILSGKSFSLTISDSIEEIDKTETSPSAVKKVETGDEYYDTLRNYFTELSPVYPDFTYADGRKAAYRNLKEKTYEDYINDRNKINDYASGFIGALPPDYTVEPNEGWSRLIGKYISGIASGKAKIDYAFINNELREFQAEDELAEKLWSLIPIYCSGIEQFKYNTKAVNNTGDVIYHRCRRVSFRICGCPHHCHFCYIVSDCIMEIPLSYRPVNSSLEALTYLTIMESRKDRASICAQIMAEIKSLKTKSLTGRLYDYKGFVGGM